MEGRPTSKYPYTQRQATLVLNLWGQSQLLTLLVSIVGTDPIEMGIDVDEIISL